MMSPLETLPNEVFIIIFSHLSWLEMLTSLWSLNNRINNLICSIVSMNDSKRKSGLIMKDLGLSYNECHSRLLPLLDHSSLLPFCSSIRHMCFDGRNSIDCDSICEWMFFQKNDKKILRFPNLKSLTITQCYLSESLTQSLSVLVQDQLDELTLACDIDMFNDLDYEIPRLQSKYGKLKKLFKYFLRELFSSRSRLTYLRLDIGRCQDVYLIDQCIKLFSPSSQNPVSNKFLPYSTTLCRLYIHIRYTYILEHIIKHVPSLEQLTIKFNRTLHIAPPSISFIEKSSQSNESWFNKVPKLRYFSLKTIILNDLEFTYLKWLLNNLNHVEKLKLHLGSDIIKQADQDIWESPIDANFVQRHCLPDIINKIIYFDFFISCHIRLQPIDVENVVNSFKCHPLFVSRQWANIKCFYNPIVSCLHLFSTYVNPTLRFYNGLVTHSYLFHWPNIQYIAIDLHPSLYVFLQQLDEIFSCVSPIKVYTENYRSCEELDFQSSLTEPFKVCLSKVEDIHFRNITKLKFGNAFTSIGYLRSFEKNALSTVRYAEFGIPSCNLGSNESAYIGKHLVPFLSIYMPNLHSLHLWRPDDFPWTTIRPDIPNTCFRMNSIRRWIRSLTTPESIVQHVSIFEQDLCQLVEQLKHFVFLHIRGDINHQKVEAYQAMVQNRFPNSRSFVNTSKFSLWL
ncbi:unnamed protein product [Rotaria magnacalcarata]|uniref:F-box domain-containing protein n=2 Tax=Rotaria magnacalcarata TaxID=392030 RepID=A0A815WU19_9BILA|nr:unnamed protein product [Rotaria magnacalcarata]